MERINQLMASIQKKKSKIKQIEEKLVLYKHHKQFLDTLAISAGKKNARKRSVVQKETEELNKNLSPPKKQDKGTAKQKDGGFFMTQISQQQTIGGTKKSNQ